MSLTVLVVSASKLQNVEGFGKSDPFCVIDLEGKPPCVLAASSHSLPTVCLCRREEGDQGH